MWDVAKYLIPILPNRVVVYTDIWNRGFPVGAKSPDHSICCNSERQVTDFLIKLQHIKHFKTENIKQKITDSATMENVLIVYCNKFWKMTCSLS